MTWYARQIFAHNRPEVLEALRGDARLSGHIYVIDNLSDFRETRREPYAISIPAPGEEPETLYRDVTYEPGLPPGGLIVVRELVEAGSHAAQWVGDAALNHAALDDHGVSLAAPESDAELAGVLGYCKGLSQRTGATVCYFTTDFWGGDCDDARGWVFEGPVDIYYGREGKGARVAASLGGTSPESRHIVDGDPLTLCMLHFDLLLRSGYFLPHTRSFPWVDFLDSPD